MRRLFVSVSSVLALVALAAYVPAAAPPSVGTATGPVLQSLGPLTFADDGTMFAADAQTATVFALDLGEQASGGVPGTADVANLDQKIAAMLGAEVWDIAITDLNVHPKTHNSFV